jgi:hypothetical protein
MPFAESLALLEEQVANLAVSAQTSLETLATELRLTQTGFAFISNSRPLESDGQEERTLEQLQERIAQLTIHVEASIASLATKLRDVDQDGSTRSSRRRSSSYLADLTRQVQQLTSELAEKSATMQEQKQTAEQVVEKQVVFMLLPAAADICRSDQRPRAGDDSIAG